MFDAFTSDPHYGHANVIRYSNRPFASVDEMNEFLITRYNEIVGPHDNCLWVGDCFLCPMKEAEAIMSRLNGRKFLIRGNHDRKAARMAALGFDMVTDKMTLNIAGQTVRASHFPYPGTPTLELNVEPEEKASDNKELEAEKRKKKHWERARGEFLLHGHTHSRNVFNAGDRRQIHVGVDAWEYHPARIEEIQKIITSHK
jgi:calcineurin-like phosphoesterase family protein